MPCAGLNMAGQWPPYQILGLSIAAVRQAYTDNDVSTTFHWERPHALSSESSATLTWRVPADAVTGTYRLRHRGDYKHIFGGTTPFTGVSRECLSACPVSTHMTLQGHTVAAICSGVVARPRSSSASVAGRGTCVLPAALGPVP